MFLFYNIVDTRDEMSAHPGLEKKTVSKITRQEHHGQVESGQSGPSGPGMARPVHHGY